MNIEAIMVFSWNSHITYCLDREGIFMSRSRGYFHVSIKRVFSTRSDLNLTFIWQVSLIITASIFFLMNIKEELNLTFIWSSVCFWRNDSRRWIILWKGFGIFFNRPSVWIDFWDCMFWMGIDMILLPGNSTWLWYWKGTNAGSGILRTKFF